MKYLFCIILLGLPFMSWGQKVCFENCIEAFQKIEGKSQMAKMMAANRLLKGMVGDCSMPEFEAITISGDTMTAASLDDKVVVMNFWFTTCPPCIAELPGLNKLVEEFGADDVIFLAIGRDPDSAIKAFLEKRAFDYMHIPDATNDGLLGKFCILGGFPTNMVFDKDGVLRHVSMGGNPQQSLEKYHELKPVIKRSLKK